MLSQEAYTALPYRKNVGVVLIAPDRRLFAGQRIDNPGDAWQMPQGGIDRGENPRQAALRELEEETGAPARLVEIVRETDGWVSYDLPRELASTIWKGRFRGQKQKWFAMRWLGSDNDIDIARGDPEFSRWAWMDHATLLDRIVPFKRPVYRQVFDEFADLLR